MIGMENEDPIEGPELCMICAEPAAQRSLVDDQPLCDACWDTWVGLDQEYQENAI